MSVERSHANDTESFTTAEYSENETLIIGGESTYAQKQIAETMAARHLLEQAVRYQVEWKLRGDCGQLETTKAMYIFFGPAGPEHKDLKMRREQLAKNICRGCKVLSNCLAYAIKHDEKGIWGGTTENERREY